MKTLLTAAALAVLVSVPARANLKPLNYVGFYGNAAGLQFVWDTGPGFIEVYVIHQVMSPPGEGGVGGLRFSAPPPPCFQGTVVGETKIPSYTYAGDLIGGYWVWYNDCLSGSIHVMTISYSVSGDTWDCCLFAPQPHPQTGMVE